MADYTLSAKITGDASKFQKAMQQAETSMQKLNQKFGSFGGALETLGGKMTSAGTKITALEAAAGGAAVALGTQAVKAGASFEAEMSKVSAISGSTGNDLKSLTDKAKEMGKKTKFSATESAEAFEYMAMAGWKTDDMLNGIEGIMNLAAASGEDLATTSDIVTDALTAFGLSASDSAEFSDVLAAASSFRDKPIDPATAAIGEVGLTGEIRAVTGLQQRLSEASRTGFKTCIIPRHGTGNVTAPDGMELLRVRNIREAIELVLS